MNTNLIRTAFAQLLKTELAKIAATCPHQDRAECGGLFVKFELEDMKSVHHDEVQPNDYVIHHDYWMDELNSPTEENEVLEWLDKEVWSSVGAVDRLMFKYGYEPVDTTDGSGGGLYYGSTLYRKC